MDNAHNLTAPQLIAALPPERISTYLQDASSDPVLALNRYFWNISAADPVHRVVSILEVKLRHEIDLALRDWNVRKGHTTSWMTDPAAPLSHIISPEGGKSWAERADTKTVADRRNPTHGDLVAGTDFGSWLFLLQRPWAKTRKPWMNDDDWDHARTGITARGTLWDEVLRNRIFPGQEAGPAFRYLSHCVDVRNRAAHHRPLFKLSASDDEKRFEQLQKMHRYAGILVRGLDYDLGQWMVGNAWIPIAISRFPRPRCDVQGRC